MSDNLLPWPNSCLGQAQPLARALPRGPIFFNYQELNNKLSNNVLGADFIICGNRGNVISTIQNNQANGSGLATLNLTSVNQTSSIVCGASNGLILSTKSHRAKCTNKPQPASARLSSPINFWN